jgi:hypothetical protein
VWSAGNGVSVLRVHRCYGDRPPGLADHEKESGVQTSLTWLLNRLPGFPSPIVWRGASSPWRHCDRDVNCKSRTLSNTSRRRREYKSDARGCPRRGVSKSGSARGVVVAEAPATNGTRTYYAPRVGSRPSYAGRRSPSLSETRRTDQSRYLGELHWARSFVAARDRACLRLRRINAQKLRRTVWREAR